MSLAVFTLTWRLGSKSPYGHQSSSAELFSPRTQGVVLYCGNDKLGLEPSDLQNPFDFLYGSFSASITRMMECGAQGVFHKS